MWEHYKKTLFRMQVFILLISGALYYTLGRRFLMAVTFYAIMQLGALVGAWWGDRLRRRLHPEFY